MTMGKGNGLELRRPKSAPLACRRLYIVPVMCYNRVVDGVFSSVASSARSTARGCPDTVRNGVIVMAKSNKVAAAVAKSVNPVFAANILAKCETVAGQALDVQIDSAKATESFREAFADLCIAAGVPTIEKDGAVVFNRESEVGKALDKVLRDKATESAKKRSHYDIAVAKVGDSDRYMPVKIWSSLKRKWEPVAGVVSNHTFTAAFALGVDLKSLSNVVEAPYGAKAWMRGGASGCRPDGKGQGQRDWIKNDIDQALSRGWRMDQSKRSGGNNKDFADLLAGLEKAGVKKRARWEKDNGEGSVVSEDQWSTLCSIIVEAAFDPDLCDELIGRSDRT